MLGRLESGFRAFGVADVPLINDVVRRDLVDLRGFLRGGEIGNRRQHAVIDLDLFCRVARLRQRVRDHHRDRVADIADLAVRERRMRRHLHRRTVLGMNHPAADQIADLVGGEIGTGEDRQYARHRGGRFSVDRFDRGVGVRRADEERVTLAGPVDVVGVVALTGNEAVIFLAAHGGADPGRAHGGLLRFFVSLRTASVSPSIRRPWRRRGPSWHARRRQSP